MSLTVFCRFASDEDSFTEGWVPGEGREARGEGSENPRGSEAPDPGPSHPSLRPQHHEERRQISGEKDDGEEDDHAEQGKDEVRLATVLIHLFDLGIFHAERKMRSYLVILLGIVLDVYKCNHTRSFLNLISCSMNNRYRPIYTYRLCARVRQSLLLCQW